MDQKRTIKQKLTEDFYRQSAVASLAYCLIALGFYLYPVSEDNLLLQRAMLLMIAGINIVKFFIGYSKFNKIESVTTKHLYWHLTFVILNSIALAIFFSYLVWHLDIHEPRFWLVLFCIYIINTASAFSVVISPRTIVIYLSILGLIPSLALMGRSIFVEHRVDNSYALIMAFSFLYYVFLLLRARAHQRMVNSLYQLELDFFKQEALAKEAMRLASVGEMASGMAHEINNPLTIVLSNTKRAYETIEKNPSMEEAEEIKKRLGKAIEASKRIEAIINSLKTLASSRSSDEKVFELIEMKLIIDRALDLCQERLSLSGVEVEKKYADQDTIVYANRSELSQVIYHLLINSLDALKGVSSPRIMIEQFSLDGKVYVKIRDNGLGINPEFRDKIFLPFFTTKNSVLNHGVGLSSCLSIILHHQGEIWLSSSPEAIGTEITFWIKGNDSLL